MLTNRPAHVAPSYVAVAPTYVLVKPPGDEAEIIEGCHIKRLGQACHALMNAHKQIHTHGTARHGTARHGTARHGTAQHGTAPHARTGARTHRRTHAQTHVRTQASTHSRMHPETHAQMDARVILTTTVHDGAEGRILEK